jgi:photosystem II stability/assembly factor-like uncharacterized protein
MTPRLCVGTAGLSVWFSDDLGESWDRPYSESGLYLEARVWALSWHPSDPNTVFAGTDSGVYRWDGAAKTWTHLPSPMDALSIWSLEQAPHDGDLMLAGTQPAALYRSRDRGLSWEKLPAAFPDECMFVHKPRVTQILFDPLEKDTVWAGVEIGGVWRSTDGGDSWSPRNDGLISEDIHGLAVVGRGGRKLFATTNKGLHVSTDDGATWRQQVLDSPWQYTRAILPANGAVFLANGNGPPGSTGRLLRSADDGESWRDVGLPGALNSTPWCIATNPADRDLMFVLTNLGQMFRSTDGGATWTKLDREFGEVRAALWHPVAA